MSRILAFALVASVCLHGLALISVSESLQPTVAIKETLVQGVRLSLKQTPSKNLDSLEVLAPPLNTNTEHKKAEQPEVLEKTTNKQRLVKPESSKSAKEETDPQPLRLSNQQARKVIKPPQQKRKTRSQSSAIKPFLAGKITDSPRQDSVSIKKQHVVMPLAHSQAGAVSSPSSISAAPSADLLRLIHQAISQQKKYPFRARRRGWQGRPVVSFELHPNGEILHLKLVAESDHNLLDQAAVKAVSKASPIAGVGQYLRQPLVMRLGVRFRLE